MENKVVDIKLERLKNRDGSLMHAIFMACNIGNKPTAGAFVTGEVAFMFRTQKLLSPDATMLLITAVGDLPAVEFAVFWRERCAADPLLKTLMGTMKTAVVIQGNSQGETLGEASLI